MRSKGKLSVPQLYIISSKVVSEIPTGYYCTHTTYLKSKSAFAVTYILLLTTTTNT